MGFFDKAKGFFGSMAPVLGIGSAVAGDYLGMQADERSASRARTHADEAAARDYAIQKEFAQHGIRWRVEDAKAAGLHPLAALGMSGAGYSPSGMSVMTGSSPRGDFYRSAGQNISRAMMATATKEDRISRYLTLERQQLENDVLRADLDFKRSGQIGPGMPTTHPFGSVVEGQGDSTSVDIAAAKIWQALGFRGSAPHRNRVAQERGYRPDVSFSQGDKAVYPVIPESLSESMEDDLIGKVLWRIRNQVVPNFGAGKTPPKSDLPPGYKRWRWSFIKQGWVPERKDYKTWFERME